MSAHSISEDWGWLVRNRADGVKEIFGVEYPNGDRVLAVNMPPQQWKAYLRKGHLKTDNNGNISVIRDN